MAIKIYKTKKPKMTDCFGRTWDSIKTILPSGEETRGYLDTTWGQNVYFCLNGEWKKTDVQNINDRQRLLDLRQRVGK